MSALAHKGLTVTTVVTERFSDLATGLLREKRETDLPLIIVGHPVGGISRKKAKELINDDVLARTVFALTVEDKKKDDAQKTSSDSPQSELLELDGDEQHVAETFHKLGFTDGLPIIVPTVERTKRMLLSVAYAPAESVGKIMPRGAPATVQKLAANAVMAGCLPEYF
jgi:hypothetical protein